MRTASLVFVFVFVFAAACGGSKTPSASYQERSERSSRGSERLTAAAAAHDEAAIAALLAPDVVFGGAWFADAACRQQFSTVGAIPASAAPTFAHCLATLGLAPAPYKMFHPEVQIFTHGPGLLLDVRFDADHDGHLVYLGYAGRRTEQEAQPVITGDALLEHRTDASTFELDEASRAEIGREVAARGGLEPAKLGEYVATAPTWVRVCIDAAGAVTSATVREADSVVAGEAVAAWARTWTFRPIALGDQPTPVCGIVWFKGSQPASPDRMPSPVPATQADAIMLPPLGKLRRSAPPVAVPSPEEKTLLRERGNSPLASIVGYCIDARGAVTETWTVLPTSFPAYDARLRQATSILEYAPYVVYGKPRPVCTTITFTYRQR